MTITEYSTPIVLWAVFLSTLSVHVGLMRHFEATLKAEDFRLWESLVLRQVDSIRLVRGGVFFSFLSNGDFRCLSNAKISRATYSTGITTILFSLSAGVLYWYYQFYLPHHK